MKSINFVILGDPSIATELGKKGTATDITIYDRKTTDVVFTYSIPSTFPDKIQSLVQSINMAEYAILNVTKIDRFLGEQIISLDSLGVGEGYILHSYEIDDQKLRSLIRNTSVNNFKFVENMDQLKKEINTLSPKQLDGPSIIPVDHAFDVKGVGTVILGVVRQGIVNVHDQLTLLPSGKSILVKSIQMHDDPVDVASSPARVGLAIKGMSAEDISRGDVLLGSADSKSNSPYSVTSTSIKFKKSSFFKGELSENQTCMISIGLQVKPAQIKRKDSDDVLHLALEKPTVIRTGQKCLLLKPDNPGTRIIGMGIIQ